MTTQEKQQILRLNEQGLGYKAIALKLNISKNTVASVIRRNNGSIIVEDLCPFCGGQIIQTKGHRQRKFCSDTCRKRYWKDNAGDRHV